MDGGTLICIKSDMNTLGTRLRYARELAGYATAKDAAKVMGLPVSTYIGHENGSRGYPAKRATEYAYQFKVSEEWLLFGKGKGPAAKVVLPARPYSGDMDIRDRIRSVIEANPNFSIRGVSLSAGLSDSMLHKFLNGATDSLNLKTVDMIADALNVEPQWLAYGDGDPERVSTLANVWDRIAEPDRAQALRILETFARTPTDD